MVYTKNKNHIKRKRKNNTIKKSKRNFKGGTKIGDEAELEQFLKKNQVTTELTEEEIEKLKEYYMHSEGFTLDEIDDMENGGTINIKNVLDGILECLDDSGKLNQNASPKQKARQTLYNKLKEKIPAINSLNSRKIHRIENIIVYDNKHFRQIHTEGKENKCLYFAYVRSQIEDVEFDSEELFAQIEEINEKVYQYMKKHAQKHGYTQENIALAKPSNTNFQEHAQLIGLVNATDSIILVNESYETNPAVKVEHFNLFYPVKKTEEEYNKMQIIFMENKQRIHFTGLVPKNPDIKELYRQKALYEILETEKGRIATEARAREKTLEEPEAVSEKPKSYEGLQKQTASAKTNSLTTIPDKGSSKVSERPKRASFDDNKLTDLEVSLNKDDKDEANDSENEYEYDNEVVQTLEGEKPPQGRPETPSLIHPDQLKPPLSTRSPGPETPSLLHPQQHPQRPETPSLIHPQSSRPETPRPTFPSRRDRPQGQSQNRSKINTDQIGEAEKTAAPQAAPQAAPAPEQTSISRGSGLPSTSFANNINRAGNILPKLEPLPVLVGLVGLGVILTIN